MAKKISYQQALTMQAVGARVTPRVYPNNYVTEISEDTIVLAHVVRHYSDEGIIFWASLIENSAYIKSIKWLRV